MLFGAGREKKIYAVPPYTTAVPLDFEDVPFTTESFGANRGGRFRCAKCGAEDTFLDEFFEVDGSKHHACSDTEYCDKNRMQASRGAVN